ncbi:MAG: hypothetical protein RI958_1550 [Actinomycetota bacterium]
MASHNRRELTLACLASLRSQRVADVDLRVLVVDDGSTDGTGDAIRTLFPEVLVVDGSGSLFWGGGMRLGIARALTEGADVLWLANDDVVFEPDALQRSLDVVMRPGRPWAVGAVCKPGSAETTYSGFVRVGRRRPRLAQIDPTDQPRPIVMGPANSLVIWADAYVAVGGLDRRFPHGYGDFDLTRRAIAAGFPLLLVPGHVGSCAANPPPSWRDPGVSLAARFADLHSIRNRPFRLAVRYTLRHYGVVGVALVARPYVEIVSSWALRRVRWLRRRRPTPRTPAR